MKFVLVLVALACLFCGAYAQPNCPQYNNDCGNCVLQPECGYCASSNECLIGTADGPNANNCTITEWDFSYCPQIACTEYDSCDSCLLDPRCVYCTSLAASTGTGGCVNTEDLTDDCEAGSNANYDVCGNDQEVCEQGFAAGNGASCTECVPSGYPEEVCNNQGRCSVNSDGVSLCTCLDGFVDEAGEVVDAIGAECEGTDSPSSSNPSTPTDCTAGSSCNPDGNRPADRRVARDLENGALEYNFPNGAIPTSAGDTTVVSTFLFFENDGTPEQGSTVNIRSTQPNDVDLNDDVEALAFKLTIAAQSDNAPVDLTGTGTVRFNYETYGGDDSDDIRLFYFKIPSGQTASNGDWVDVEDECDQSSSSASGNTVQFPICVSNVQYQGYLKENSPEPPSPSEENTPEFTFSAASMTSTPAVFAAVVAAVVALAF